MYYVVTYDIASEQRLPKALKYCRRYFNWVQNSAFEGDLTEKQFTEFREGLEKIIDEREDSVLIYETREPSLVSREIYGVEKNVITKIL